MQADQRHSYDLHQQKLNAIKPSIDCTPPGHWSSSKTKSNGKKAVLQAEQASTIEKVRPDATYPGSWLLNAW